MHQVLELDVLGEARNGDVQQILASMTGRQTVPNVIVRGKSIGGGSRYANTGAVSALLEKSTPLALTSTCTRLGRSGQKAEGGNCALSPRFSESPGALGAGGAAG